MSGSYSLTASYDDLYHRYITCGQSVSTIAKADGVTSTTVRRTLTKLQIPLRASSRELKKADSHKRNRVSSTLKEGSFAATIGESQLRELYTVQGLSGVEIAKLYNVNPTNVYNALKYYNVDVVRDSFHSMISDGELKELYINQSMSVYDIGTKYNVDPQRVVTALKAHGIDIKDRSARAKAAQREVHGWSDGTALKIDDGEWLQQQLSEYTQAEVAEQLGCSQTAISDACKRFNITPTRKISGPQRKLQAFLTQEGIEFSTNDRVQISPYELDIVVPSHKLAIEVNGEWWHCDAHERITRDYHQTKTQRCLDAGWTLFQIWAREIVDDELFDIIKDKIRTFMHTNVVQRVFARRCTISELSSKEATEFFDVTHIQQGKASASIHYALHFESQVVACISFKRNSDGGLYLSRFSSGRDTVVVGGFTKLLQHAISRLSPRYIETYSNGRFHKQNNVYERAGFKCEGWTVPNYEYLKNGKYLSRQQAQKHKLAKWLQPYDPNATEQQNMRMAGWYRLYDCGHVRYTLTCVE